MLRRMVCTRLLWFFELVGGLSKFKYGFLRVRSTIDAISIIVDPLKKAIFVGKCYAMATLTANTVNW